MNKSKLRTKDFIFTALGVGLSSTSILGCAAVFGFSLVIFFRHKKLIATCSIFFAAMITLAGPNLLSIDRSKIDLSLAAVLGDVKCIAQHPAAEISDSDWEELLKLGPKGDWLNPASCAIADYAFFALDKASDSKPTLVKVWLSMIKSNPQIMMQARIQRASNALPPVFFRSPPNMFDTSYSNPVGAFAGTDLQISPDLFKTSVDLDRTQIGRLPAQSVIETFVLAPTFLLNQRSDLWGWGGFWLTIAIFAALIRFGKESTSYLVNLVPLIFMHLTVVLFSPSPSPRYLFPSILVGLISGIYLASGGLNRVKTDE
jgi:hypothetical protein